MMPRQKQGTMTAWRFVFTRWMNDRLGVIDRIDFIDTPTLVGQQGGYCYIGPIVTLRRSE